MVSGFTLCHSATREETKFGSVHWRNFFVRRFFRIAPLFFVGAIYFQAADPFGVDIRWAPNGRGVPDYAVFLTLLHGFWPPALSIVPGGWSIGAEWVFYLVFGLVWKHSRSVIGAAFTLLFALQIGFLFRCGVAGAIQVWDISDTRWVNWIDLSPPGRCAAFFLGVFLYSLASRISFREYRWGLVVLAALWFVCAVYRTLPLTVFPLSFITSLGFGSFLLAYCRTESLAGVWRPIAFLGKISFSIYVAHFAVLTWTVALQKSLQAAHPTLGVTGYFLVVLSLSALISTLTWKCIETPGIKVGKMLQVQRKALG